MIFLLTHNDKVNSCRNLTANKLIQLHAIDAVEAMVEIAQSYPKQWIVWSDDVDNKEINFEEIVKHEANHKMMASHNMGNQQFMNADIGYIDENPFLNVKKGNLYPTWQMTRVGFIYGEMLGSIISSVPKTKSLLLFLNHVARLGQKNGLLCYQLPLVTIDIHQNRTTSDQLFNFVSRHYKKRWLPFLLLCKWRYHKELPIGSFIKSLFLKKIPSKITLPMESPSVAPIDRETVDVLIPTMGREKYLFDVLKDLSVQSHLPKKVIIVEQNPSVNSSSQLDYVDGNTWPFEIKHLFINRTGACNARNLGLEQVTSDWVFLADDDIRFDVPLIEDSIAFAKANHVKALTVSCLPMGQEEKLLQPIQWNAFGSGCSFVAGSALENLRFDLAMEHGYGEDADFGNRLRDSGVDILYHPDIRIKHLKAPMGGFRAMVLQAWEKDQPKPSPTVMISMLRNYTREQLAGYKLKLWIKFYVRQEVKNPFTYIKMIRSRWEASQQWAQSLLSSSYEN